MADSGLSDEQLRKELTAHGERNIPPITGTTRPTLIKKLNHLEARQKKSARPASRKTTGKKLLGFSSDESENEGDGRKSGGPAPLRRGRAAAAREASEPRRAGRAPGRDTSRSTPSGSSKSTASTRKPSKSYLEEQEEPSEEEDEEGDVASTSSRSISGLTRPRMRRSYTSTTVKPDQDTKPLSYKSSYLSQRSLQGTGSIGLQTSFADSDLDSREEVELENSSSMHRPRRGEDMPDAFDSSDSDFDQTMPSSPEPELVTRGINTSPSLDDSYASSGYSHIDSPAGNSSFMPSNSFCTTRPRSKDTGPSNSILRRSILTTPPKTSSLFTPSPGDRLERKKTVGSAKRDGDTGSFGHCVSTCLVTLLALFFATLAVIYWNVRYVDNISEESGGNLMRCPEDIHNGEVINKKENCFTKEQISGATDIIMTVTDELHYQAGQYKCGYSSEGKNMSMEEVEDFLRTKYGKRRDLEAELLVTLRLIKENPSWDVSVLDEAGQAVTGTNMSAVRYLESAIPEMSFLCRLLLAINRVITFIIAAVIVVLVICLLVFSLRYHWKRKEQETRQLYDMVEQIIDILKGHHEDCQSDPTVQPFLAIPHVRDVMIPPQERRKKQGMWDKAVKFLSANESRVRVEVQTIAGEEFAVWRWLQVGLSSSPCPNGTKVWQGQAFGEHKDGGLNMPPCSPTPCLKIRNMFDIDVEYGDNWHVYIQDAILEKCGADNGILHVAVDKTSKEGCVYVKCLHPEAAGKAYRSLHGWWFDGNLVTVKFIRLERYHERFPGAKSTTSPLRPSNNEKLSLSQPFYHSVIETS